jgi:endonuclease IV
MAIDNSEQIAALRAAIATGARRIVFHSGGTRREVEYHSLKDMREALTWLEGQQEPKPAVSYLAFSKG